MSAQILIPSHDTLQQVVAFLRAGGLVGMPTETVYGLAADATSDNAVASIYNAKERPQFNPLICHVSNLEMAQRYVVWNEIAQKLAEAFWPGPLTMILPRKNEGGVSLLATAGLDSLAVRSPAHPVARELLSQFGKGIVAPSANRSGRVSPTTAQHVYDELKDRISLILDGGACSIGIESTVISLLDLHPVILRSGSITKEEITAVLREEIVFGESENILSPGQLASHYAPSIPVRLNVIEPKPTEALLTFGSEVPSGGMKHLHLSTKGDCKEAAANLFAMLRELDSTEFSAIAVMPIPETGIGIAINDRLKRAATR